MDFLNLFLHFLFCNTWTSSTTHACSTTNSLGHPSVWEKRKKNPLLPTILVEGIVAQLCCTWWATVTPFIYKRRLWGSWKVCCFHFPTKRLLSTPTPLLCCSLFFHASAAPAKKKSANYPIDSVCMCVCMHLVWFCSGLCALTWRKHTKEHVYLLVAHRKISPGYAREVAKL